MKHPTIFCDIDGTIFKYRKFETMRDEKAELIDGIQAYLQIEAEKGAHIVITTARPEKLRGFTEYELSENDIPYDQLVMGIGRGVRILINDSEFEDIPRAIAIPIKRNQSINEYL
jgi:Trk K+ transport system NAD-binding subunit